MLSMQMSEKKAETEKRLVLCWRKEETETKVRETMKIYK